MSGVTINTTGGGGPPIELTIEDFAPTQGDCILAAQVQRSRLLRRTENGTDYTGAPLAPYNRSRVFYYYPNGPVGKDRSSTQLTSAKAAVRRFANKVGRTKGAITRSKLGIRFNSYDDFKHTYLGRDNVDLRGPRAPHMLQELVCRAGGIEVGGTDRLSADSNETPANEFTIGIYGEASDRAAGINSESRPRGMPRRQFLGSTEEDNRYLTELIAGRARQRAERRLAGR
jgi:hypothetical protein